MSLARNRERSSRMTLQDITTDALVIGAGPAGLMAADALAAAGYSVLVADQKPSVARKFLMAGKSGLNLTKAEPFDAFMAHYGPHADALRPMIERVRPEDVANWAQGLGQEVFTGSTGRVFPKVMKASPLLRAWLARLDGMGVTVNTRWRWTGWKDGAAVFDTPDGRVSVRAKAMVLAMGGASWRRLGSDGAWANTLTKKGIPTVSFGPSNVGLTVPWSPHMAKTFGSPIKNARFFAGDMENRGEAVISAKGLEGGGIYPLAPALRKGAMLHIDLMPDVSENAITKRLSKPRGKDSKSNALRKALRVDPAKLALLMEYARPLPDAPQDVAKLVKALPITNATLRPMDEAISTSGGIPFETMNDGLMLNDMPGVFAAGEMLDWDAPTGGYLLTACFATGLWAGQHAARWIADQGSAAAF